MHEHDAGTCCLPGAGEKLIDHLKKWLEPDKLLSVAHSWDPGQECHIAAAILDLFHLLPPPAVKFLETGVRAPACCCLCQNFPPPSAVTATPPQPVAEARLVNSSAGACMPPHQGHCMWCRVRAPATRDHVGTSLTCVRVC